jgi:hypothetical protein
METVVVIMLKDKKTGFLDKELCSLSLTKNEEYIINVFVTEEEDGRELHLRLSTERDVADWEYSAIFDYYDTERFAEVTDKIFEIDDYFNPAWELVLPYSDEPAEVEEKVVKILELHHTELSDVYNVIADKESEYENENE